MPTEVIAFGTSAKDVASEEDAAFLTLLDWKKSGDSKLIAAARQADVVAFCKVLRRTLSKRRSSGGGKSFRRNSAPQLLQPLWSKYAWEDATTTDVLSHLLVDLQKQSEKAKSTNALASRTASKRVMSAWESAPPEASPWAQVVWLTLLLETADLMDDQTLLPVWRGVLAEVLPHAENLLSESTSSDAGFVDDRQLLMTGELPWLAGLVFADVKGAGKIQRGGRNRIRTQLEESTDSDGSPHARLVDRLPLTLAVFTRSLSAARRCGESLFNAKGADRFEQLIIRTSAMARACGTLALSNGESFATGSLLQTASALTGSITSDPPFRRLREVAGDTSLKELRSSQKAPRLPKIKRERKRKFGDPPSTQSDWAELICMRNNWSTGGDSCVIAHHTPVPKLSVTAFERLLMDGDWHLDVEVDEAPIGLADDWSCVCWFSDEDADYVELQQQPEPGVTLLRQALLSRTDHWLLLADNLTLDRDQFHKEIPVRLTSRFPCAGNVQMLDNRWTRDLKLRCEKLKAQVYPLGLEQERLQRADGSLTTDGHDLVLSQSSSGGSLHMPLVIDWSPDRQQNEAEWRQLTVAEDGRRLPRHIASGQRLRIGRHQWLFYRSHQPGETGRSLLGHHTPHETVIAEFTSLGEVEPILVVE